MSKIHFAIDLDGTLLEYDGNYKGDKLGKPITGALEFVKAQKEAGNSVTVFTTRTNFEEIATYLKSVGFPLLKVTNIKSSHFTVFIDDRAMRFSGNWSEFKDDLNVNPWWKN